MKVTKALSAIALVVLTGCSTVAERRLLVIHEARLAFVTHASEPSWTDRRAIAAQNLELEDLEGAK